MSYTNYLNESQSEMKREKHTLHKANKYSRDLSVLGGGIS